MTQHEQKARQLFVEGYNCSQAVFAAFCDVTGMSESQALKLSSSFGGGMGRMREVCGACTGMFAVAGLLWGYESPEDDNAKKEHYALIQKLAEKFKETHGGTIVCRELLKGIAAGTTPMPTKRDSEFYKVRPCVAFVETAARLLDEEIKSREK